MKQSLKNDKGLAATKPVNEPGTGDNKGLPTSGDKMADSCKLLDGKPVTFKNAEASDGTLKSYNFAE